LVKTLSAAELRDLPTAVDIVTAGRAFGIGRTKSHELARAGQFPVPVLRLGSSYRVTRAALLRALGESPTDEPGEGCRVSPAQAHTLRRAPSPVGGAEATSPY
jgi:hypothetical protein